MEYQPAAKRNASLTCMMTWVTLDGTVPHTRGDTVPGSTHVIFWRRQSSRDRKQITGRLEVGQGMGYRGLGNFEDEGHILYLDCSGGYRTVCICQTSKNYMLQRLGEGVNECRCTWINLTLLKSLAGEVFISWVMSL